MDESEILDRVLYRDASVLVVDKPSGLPVHKGPKGGQSFEDYFDYLRFGLPRRPSLAHRLDRETSGCLVLGRHRQALIRLGNLFKSGQIEKTYLAIVTGVPETDSGEITAPLGRRDPKRGWWMKIDPEGQPAHTRWQVLERGQDETGAPLSLLALSPLTGRTHQLRVHCASIGCPILGESIYAPSHPTNSPYVGLHLHAHKIVIPFLHKKPPIEVTAPLPLLFLQFVDKITKI